MAGRAGARNRGDLRLLGNRAAISSLGKGQSLLRAPLLTIGHDWGGRIVFGSKTRESLPKKAFGYGAARM